jgi:hypothetical protein
MYTFVESSIFARHLAAYWTDEEYTRLQLYLATHPEAGDLVPGSGGVRKLCWKTTQRGKRGGLRVLYYLHLKHGEIWLLTLYGKNVRENIPGHVLKQLKEMFEHDEI